MPFASASIGKSYRNEVLPGSGLLRVREFLIAEVKHFVDLEGKRHRRFAEVEGVELPFLGKETQLSGKSQVICQSIGEAVPGKTVDNVTPEYFLARIYLFLIKLGVDGKRLRFGQHLTNEVTHHACDC